ncbi:MAG: MFS transporter [Novosphingobium sp.]
MGEFRSHWRALAGASLGLAVGYSFINYVTNVFAPTLVAELGWAKSDFALLGLMVFAAVICQPIAGRLADVFGVRRVALLGVIVGPLLFLALSRMNGAFWQFYLISVLQVVLVGATTGPAIYTRVIAERFHAMRGTALGLASCSPAVVGLACAPLFASLVSAHGWRASYAILGAVIAVVGLLAIALIPRRVIPSVEASSAKAETTRDVRYGALFRSRTFLLIVCGILLCNMTLTLQMSQIGLLLAARGVDATAASFMISLYAGGIIAGRLLCGVALDYFPPYLVSALTMAAPAIGLLLLASGISAPLALAAAVAILGLSFGAEGDIGAYLVMRYFGAEIFGTVFGLVMRALALSGAIGALLLSYTLAVTGDYRLFLTIGSAAAVIGGVLFLLLKNARTV